MNKTQHRLKLDVDPLSDESETYDKIGLSEDLWLTTNSPGLKDNRWKKLFGFVSARPHEYLIHIRNGKVLKETTGQASRCFKWPGDMVTVIPTSLKQLIFESGQVTLDNIHVRIRGFAIYRITDPEKISEIISFWDRWEGERKLARIIGEPCRSHTKWLVSNMTMEDCIRKRKESIADVLLKELRLAIHEQNTGVSIETVDIQDVRFGDDKLFTSFLAPSKEQIDLKREMAELERKRELEIQKLKQEQEFAEQKKIVEIERITQNDAIRLERQKYERSELEEQRRRKQEDTEHNESLADLKEERHLARQQRSAQVNHDITLADLQLTKQKAELESDILKDRANIDNSLAPAALEKAFLEKALPEVAKAVASSLANARLTIYQNQNGTGGSLYSHILNEVMAILQNRVNKLADEEEK